MLQWLKRFFFPWQYFWHQMSGFSTPTTKSLTPTRCPTIQLHSDSNYPETSVSDSVVLGSQSHETAPISDASHKYLVPKWPTPLTNLTAKSEVLTSPPQFWYFARTTHRTQESTFLTFTGLSQRIQFRKSHKEETEGKVWGRGCPLQACHPPSTFICSPAWKLSKSPVQ